MAKKQRIDWLMAKEAKTRSRRRWTDRTAGCGTEWTGIGWMGRRGGQFAQLIKHWLAMSTFASSHLPPALLLGGQSGRGNSPLGKWD